MRAIKSAALAASFIAASPVLAQEETADPTEEQAVNDIAWHTAQQTYLFDLKTADGWRYMDGGLRWRWTRYNASEDRPSVADTVTLHYEGKLIDGTVFDSSYPRGEPATFPLGRLIEGWKLAVPQMAVGEEIEIAIPSDLAYGAEGRGPIPPNATLLFKVELIAIVK
ncbi:FKBP-type peptidyl-prolyl cis-trans isomerase [Erythrobacter crassostreae]|uniref:Peptidyl-prolyl cis-trans isomerase n=1 Tax=Erythrobacter crassostreae TaxID=2828328 RepID=A0A9X1F4L5_9SPHN|nr:FKBP-type peptidyl-prolyl cis-trans isomerase [Erythrobacter crassostrea]MBV7258695.1 FKBP-type peptidyl-prolyl cis-trans isomerase [Erythrobacter crassostrea]